jgi:hypothetical protein
MLDVATAPESYGDGKSIVAIAVGGSMARLKAEAALPINAVGAILRATERSASVVHEDFKGGLNGLATIAAIGPWFGLFATVVNIPAAFIGCGGEKSACMAAFADGLSASIWPTAIGLLVGLVALWSYRYLTSRLETFDIEMRGASLELINQLARFHGQWKVGEITQFVVNRAFLDERYRSGSGFGRYSTFLTTVALPFAWCIQVAGHWCYDLVPLGSAAWRACLYVLVVFGASCILVDLVCVRLLHRRLDSVGVLASALCVVWCAADVVLSAHPL